MKRLLITAILFISFSALKAQERYIDSLFPVQKTITETYANKDGQDLIVDIYQPEGDTLKSRPAIIFMHGGGFAGGTPKNKAEVGFAELAAKKGYVAVQISYRLTRKGKSFDCDFSKEGKIETFKKAAEDYLDAVSFMIANKDKYKIDTSKIIAGGSSAGAEAILDAVYNRELLFRDTDKYQNIHFAGVFSLAGAIIDARYINKTNAVPGVFFHGTDDNLVPYATAPHHYCEPKEPGYIILDGAKSITERLEKLESSYLLHTFNGARHEISGMPFEHMPEIFDFFNKVFLKDQKLQINITQ